MVEAQIKNIIDKNLQRWVDKGLNILPLKAIEPAMCAPGKDMTQEWKTWIPVESKVTDDEINALEKTIGYKLPDSYKTFLKHRHFYELNINNVSFCAHVINDWQRGLLEIIFDGYPKEFLIDKGLIPFAMFSDWGHLCFNTVKKAEGNEYEIVLWDHDDWEKAEFKYQHFTEMLIALDKEEEEEHNSNPGDSLS